MDEFFTEVQIIISSESVFDKKTHTFIDGQETQKTIYGCIQTPSVKDTERMVLTETGKHSGIKLKLYTNEYLDMKTKVMYSIGPERYKLEIIDRDVYQDFDDDFDHYVYFLAGGTYEQ